MVAVTDVDLHDIAVILSLFLYGRQRCAFTSVSRAILDCLRSADMK